jgi:type IV secretory pathway TraG/TraD family ATPase VirD4
MLGWYLRQGWPRQLAVLAALAVVVPILWTAIASYLFVDLMGSGLRQYYPRSDIGSYLVWWDYFLTDDQPIRLKRWLVVSGATATMPFAAFLVRLVMDSTSDTKRPALYGKTGWASREDMRHGNVKTTKDLF